MIRAHRPRSLAIAISLLALASSACTASASGALSAVPAAELALPAPTGRHLVGTTSLHLRDTSRPDPWVPAAKARELMVTLWYPAKGPARQRARYMTVKESELTLKEGGLPGVPLDALSKVRTHAFSDARPAARRGGLPLVVLSPGFTKPRSSLTGLAEDLASRGYAVAGIEHTYESAATSFPDGRVTTCVACERDKDAAFWTKVETGRAADVSFVLNELTGRHPKWKHADLLNASRIGMAGHSVGGASTTSAMLNDSRLRAGINVDGTMTTPVPPNGLRRPFMLLGAQEIHSPGSDDTSWMRDWRNLAGWKRWLVVKGAEHASFTDIGVLAEQLGFHHNPGLSAVRGTEITRAYVRAFFDRHLRNRPQRLLNAPSARFPEVAFCTPADARTTAAGPCR